MHRNGHPHARVGPRELLEDEDVREEVGPAPPYSSGTHTPISPSSASFGKELVGEAVVAIPRRGVGDDLGLGQLAGEPLDLPLIGGELEVHLERLYGSPDEGSRDEMCRLQTRV